MRFILKYILIVSAATLLGTDAFAGSRSIGTVYSFSGISLSYVSDTSDDTFIDLGIKAELGELFLGRSGSPGISSSFTWNYILRRFEMEDGGRIGIIAGAGVAAGWAKDFRKLTGAFFGLQGRIGIDMRYIRRIGVSVYLNPLLCFHAADDSNYIKVSIYRNGLLNAIMPEIGIRYSF